MNSHEKRQPSTSSQQGAAVIQSKGTRYSAPKGRGPASGIQRKTQAVADNSPRVKQLKSMQAGLAVNTGLKRQSTTKTAVAQRVKWSERDVTTEVVTKSIPAHEKEAHAKLTTTGLTEERHVFVDATVRGRSGFFWRKEGTVNVQYARQNLEQYTVNDAGDVFYTAVRNESVASILTHGLDPNFRTALKPSDSAAYNTRGFIYFGATKKIPQIYGQRFLDDDYTILSFTMPAGTAVEVDPEIPGGLRTRHHIPSEDIIRK